MRELIPHAGCDEQHRNKGATPDVYRPAGTAGTRRGLEPAGTAAWPVRPARWACSACWASQACWARPPGPALPVTGTRLPGAAGRAVTPPVLTFVLVRPAGDDPRPRPWRVLLVIVGVVIVGPGTTRAA